MDHRELLLLRAARETGVLDALATSAGTPAEVAAETGVTERAATVTVGALDERGFLERVGDTYEPADRMLGFLAKADVHSIGSLPHRLDSLERWIALPETMQSGEPPEPPAGWTENRLGAVAATGEATVRACVTAAVREHPEAERVVDVGGGPGVFAREFAGRGLDATLFDRPAAVDRARPRLAHGPVDLVAGDALDGLPAGFDLAFCARVVRGFGPDENRRLLASVREALVPGGTVVLVDALRGRTPAAGLLAAGLLARTGRGSVYAEADLRAWLADAGFEDARVADVPGTDLWAVAADLPGDP